MLAVEPGDWRRVHRIERPGGILEEAVCCWSCNHLLLASPDDDIDPLQPDEDYDVNVYHRFVRPLGWEPPRQRVLDRPPREGDWVIVWEHWTATRGKREVDFYNREGEVMSIDEDGVAAVRLGHRGISAQGREPIDIPSHRLRVMAFERYTVGTEVRIIRGTHTGRRGVVKDITDHTQLRVAIDGDLITLPQEHVEIC